MFCDVGLLPLWLRFFTVVLEALGCVDFEQSFDLGHAVMHDAYRRIG